MEKRVKGILEILLVVAVFFAFSYIIQKNIEFFEGFVTNNFTGMFFYLLLEILSIVVAPVTTLPLVVVASKLWGWVAAGILNLVGWTIGSWLAFLIGRKYGVRIVRRIMSIEKVHKIEKRIPKEHLFWTVILLRMIIPADVLSYAIGMFTRMNTRSYLLATLIGIAPFAFIWAYFGGIDIKYQILLFLIAGILITIGWIVKITCKKCMSVAKKK